MWHLPSDYALIYAIFHFSKIPCKSNVPFSPSDSFTAISAVHVRFVGLSELVYADTHPGQSSFLFATHHVLSVPVVHLPNDASECLVSRRKKVSSPHQSSRDPDGPVDSAARHSRDIRRRRPVALLILSLLSIVRLFSIDPPARGRNTV